MHVTESGERTEYPHTVEEQANEKEETTYTPPPKVHSRETLKQMQIEEKLRIAEMFQIEKNKKIALSLDSLISLIEKGSGNEYTSWINSFNHNKPPTWQATGY